MKIIGSPTVTPMNPKKAGGPTTLKVTVTKLSDGSYGADHDPDLIRKAIEDNRTVVCYWYDKNTMLHLSSFQLSGPYIFTAVEGAMEYRVVIRDTDDIVCTETKLSQEAVLYTHQDLTPEQQAQARQNLGLDELPTSGGTNYRLIAKIVFDETNQPYRIQITQDMDGKPLELTKLFMYADWKAHETARADCGLYLNDEIDMPYIFNIEKTAYKHVFQAEAFDGFCRIKTDTKIEGTSKAGGGSVYVRDMAGSKITKIMWTSPLTTMAPPVGSVLAIYGY